MATVVNDADFQTAVLQSSTPVLVDFYADWCGPCQAIAPILEELAPEYEGKMTIVKLDVDASPETAQAYGVMSIPTLVIFKGGQEVDRIQGALPKDSLKAKIDANV